LVIGRSISSHFKALRVNRVSKLKPSFGSTENIPGDGGEFVTMSIDALEDEPELMHRSEKESVDWSGSDSGGMTRLISLTGRLSERKTSRIIGDWAIADSDRESAGSFTVQSATQGELPEIDPINLSLDWGLILRPLRLDSERKGLEGADTKICTEAESDRTPELSQRVIPTSNIAPT
jgi:hypothetical protein